MHCMNQTMNEWKATLIGAKAPINHPMVGRGLMHGCLEGRKDDTLNALRNWGKDG